MSAVAGAVLPLFLCYAGMAGLCLAMARHYRQVWPSRGADPRRILLFRACGAILLLLALAPCIQRWGVAVGVVLWFGYVSASALLLVGLLSKVPRVAAATAVAAPLLALVLGVGG